MFHNDFEERFYADHKDEARLGSQAGLGNEGDLEDEIMIDDEPDLE